MAVLFVISFLVTQRLAYESSNSRKLNNTVAEENFGLYDVDHFTVRFHLNWYWSGGENISSHPSIKPGPVGEYWINCANETSTCSSVQHWEFDQPPEWDLVEKLDFLAYNKTALEQTFHETAKGEYRYPLGKGVEENVSVKLLLDKCNHRIACINISLTRNGNIIGFEPWSFDYLNNSINYTFSGHGNIGDDWGLYVIIGTHDPMEFFAQVEQMVGIGTPAVAGGPFDPTIIPPTPTPNTNYTISFEKDKYEAYAGVEVFFKPCVDRTPAGATGNWRCARPNDECYEEANGTTGSTVCTEACSNPDEHIDDVSGKCTSEYPPTQSRKKGIWWWWIILVAGLVLLAIITAVILAVIYKKTRKPPPYVYVPPASMPICPVLVMCDGNTRDDPNNPLLRERQEELKREADMAAEQRERERVHQVIREGDGYHTSGRNNTAGRFPPSAGNNTAGRFSPSAGNNTAGRFPPSAGNNTAGRFSPSAGNNTAGRFPPNAGNRAGMGFSGKK